MPASPGADVILPDVNLLIYAYNEKATHHEAAREWWEGLMRADRQVALPWAVVFGFVRLVTHPAVFESPLSPEQALDRVDEWFAAGSVTVLTPGPRHLRIVRDLFAATGVAASLTTDTHLAALAIEHNVEIHSNDRDFERFPGLRVFNPIALRGKPR
jgi:toxin-antitoxin system PIN domain toxin